MMHCRHVLFAILLGAVAVAGVPASASERPPDTVTLFGQDLVLNGYGEREHWWTDIYRCALYLPARSSQPGFVFDPANAKALRIRVLYGDLPDKMPGDWREIFADELSRELLGKLKRAYRRIEEHDVLTFSYQPGRGTQVWLNDDRIITDPGHALMQALLDQWLGARPVSKNLKRLLLTPAS